MIPTFSTVSDAVLYFGAIVLLTAPALGGVLAWYGYLAMYQAGPSKVILLVLGVTTVSYGFLLLSLAVGDILGAHYSTRRFVTIYLNLGLAIVALGSCAFRATPIRRALVAFPALVALAWLYLAVVSAAV